jgi:hypothetical protein
MENLNRIKKLYSDCYLVEDFINFYNGAKRIELKQRLKDVKIHKDKRGKNEELAIITLLK